MNSLFMAAFALFLLLNLLFDLKRMRRQHKSIKALYMTVYTLTTGMFICMLLGVKLPMPTRFFINHVSPWVFSLIHP